jgi:hypothetical protein
MGSHDGTEICELVGFFILNHLNKKFGKESIGLYKDDGLALIKSKSARIADTNQGKNFTKFSSCLTKKPPPNQIYTC